MQLCHVLQCAQQDGSQAVTQWVSAGLWLIRMFVQSALCSTWPRDVHWGITLKVFWGKILVCFFFKNISQISHHEVGNSKWDTSRLVRCQGSRLVTAAFTAYSSLFLSPSVLLHIIGNTYCVSNFINSSPQIIPDPSGKLKYFDKLNWFLFPSSQSVKSSTYWKNK